MQSETFKQFSKDNVLNSEKFHLKTVSKYYVYKELLLCNLNISKGKGLDEIPARFLKEGANVLKILISYKVNLSIIYQKVPKDKKNARVKILYKKNSSLDVGNYRPLSIVSNILDEIHRVST